MEIKKLTQSEKRMAMDLAWEVFIEFEGPDYPQEGTDPVSYTHLTLPTIYSV